jgi:hypothetical protein
MPAASRKHVFRVLSKVAALGEKKLPYADNIFGERKVSAYSAVNVSEGERKVSET